MKMLRWGDTPNPRHETRAHMNTVQSQASVRVRNPSLQATRFKRALQTSTCQLRQTRREAGKRPFLLRRGPQACMSTHRSRCNQHAARGKSRVAYGSSQVRTFGELRLATRPWPAHAWQPHAAASGEHSSPLRWRCLRCSSRPARLYNRV